VTDNAHRHDQLQAEAAPQDAQAAARHPNEAKADKSAADPAWGIIGQTRPQPLPDIAQVAGNRLMMRLAELAVSAV
jgi:hypothetical protein